MSLDLSLSGPAGDYSDELLTDDEAQQMLDDDVEVRGDSAADEDAAILDSLDDYEAKLFNPAELRDGKGKWTKAGSAGDLLKRAHGGGFTFDVTHGRHATSGYVVATPGHTRIFKPHEFTPEALHAYISEKAPMLAANPHLHLGGWYDKKHDEVVLDLVEVHDDRQHAIDLGRKRGEQAIFDLNTFEEIDTGGTGGREQAENHAGAPPAGLGQHDAAGEGGVRGEAARQDHELTRPQRPHPYAEQLWGAGNLDAMFPDGAIRGRVPFPSAGARKDRKPWDADLIGKSLRADHETQLVDPRWLSATQASVTRAGVRHYLESNADITGRLFSDRKSALNSIPTIYAREDGTNMIVSGHHRAAAALLQGRMLRARVVRGPWPSR